MHRFLMILLLLAAVISAAACGSSGLADRMAAKKDTGACVAHADVDEVGYPSHVRLWAENTGSVEMVSWSWRTRDGEWHEAALPDGVYWLEITKPGTINAQLRGIDANGNTCSSPIKIRSRNNYNAAPVVLFDGPQDFGEHELMNGDGTILRYHEWRWSTSRSYDPETAIASEEWGIYGGGDLDGDGIPDVLIAGKTADGDEFSYDPGLIVKDAPEQQQFVLWVTPRFRESPTRMTVTATDTAGRKEKWGDGHVTLMK